MNKLKSPAQLANYLESVNPPKVKGRLFGGPVRACAAGHLLRISGLEEDQRQWSHVEVVWHLRTDTWLEVKNRCCPPGFMTPLFLTNEAIIEAYSDGTRGWGEVIKFLRKLKRDGTLKRGATL